MDEKQSKYSAQMRYDAKNVVKVTIKLNRKTDDDILSKIDMSKPISTQLKYLIRCGLEQNERNE